ncbi:hypothetical protein GCM10022284_19750 [Streptomyces hundungensis]
MQAVGAAGAADAGTAGSETAASAATAQAAAARDLWGVDLTRNSFEAAGIPACSMAARSAWVRRGTAADCVRHVHDH